MLHRFMFVAGMTVGVMTPLVWAAYVARPAMHATPVPTVEIAKSAPAARNPAAAGAKDVTGAIAPIPAAASATKTIALIALPRHRPNAPPRTIVRVSTKPSSRTATARVHHARHPTADGYLPAVVDHYDGAHIITVCAALSVNEQLRVGCPERLGLR